MICPKNISFLKHFFMKHTFLNGFSQISEKSFENPFENPFAKKKERRARKKEERELILERPSKKSFLGKIYFSERRSKKSFLSKNLFFGTPFQKSFLSKILFGDLLGRGPEG